MAYATLCERFKGIFLESLPQQTRDVPPWGCTRVQPRPHLCGGVRIPTLTLQGRGGGAYPSLHLQQLRRCLRRQFLIYPHNGLAGFAGNFSTSEESIAEDEGCD